MSYLKDREIWLSKVPTGNPPAGFFWKFIQNGKVVVRDSSGNDQMMIATNGNQAITGSLTVTGGITGTISSASYVQYSNVANKPTLVSGSGQISFSGITNKPTLVSGSSQVTFLGLSSIPSGIVSGSAQVTYSGLTGIPSGIVSGSSQVTFLGLSSIPSGIVSGSAQVAQFGYATTGSNGFNGSQSITGSLTVTGQVIAQTLNVQQVTSSIVFSSGSNVFGNNSGNTHRFTGSVNITGSLSVNGALSGASATFSGNVTSDDLILTAGTLFGTGNTGFSNRSSDTTLYLQMPATGFNITDNALNTRFILSSAGAATFSSSVTANGNSNTFGNASLSGRAVIIQAGSTNQAIMFKNSAGGDGTLFINGTSTTVDYNFNTYSVADALVIKNNGSIGINTSTITNPNSLNRVLVIAAAAEVGVVLNDSRDASPIGLENRGAVFHLTYGTSNLLVADGASGKVSIGTTTPLTNLTIEGTNRAFPLVYTTGHGNLHIQTNETTATQNFGGSLTFGALGRTSGPTEKFVFAAIAGRKETTTTGDPKGYLQFGTLYDDTNYINERMRITSGGFLKASNTGTYINSTGAYHEFNSNTNALFTLYAKNTNSGGEGVLSELSSSNDSKSFFAGYSASDAAYKFFVRTNGDTRNATGVYGTISSDIRLKENITDATSKLEDIMKLRVVNFNLLGKETKQIGFIAQEMQEIFPSLVDQNDTRKYDENGNLISGLEDALGVKVGMEFAILVKTIQEQQTLIESLKSRIEILEQ